jgi:molybdate transport system ATP-binding protein
MAATAGRVMSLEVSLQHAMGDFTLDAAFKAEGGVTALFGVSGAGKSSIVAMVAGLLKPDAGRIVLNGRVLTDTVERVFVAAQARRAGLVFQEARLFPHMSVEKNLRYGWRRAPDRADEKEVAHVIALLGLGDLLDRRPRTLSGGEKARVALGRALLAAPEILLLDEPLASLDAPRRAEILPYLERLRDEARVQMLYVSHQVDEVARLADRVVLLASGRVTAHGAPGETLPGLGGLGAVLDAVSLGPRDDGLTELAFDNGRLAVTQKAPPGAKLRVRLAADDILIARVQPKEISANNILRATVVQVNISGDVAEVALQAGGAWLLARITAASAQRLALAPGLPVFAIVKSVTVDSGTPASSTR